MLRWVIRENSPIVRSAATGPVWTLPPGESPPPRRRRFEPLDRPPTNRLTLPRGEAASWPTTVPTEGEHHDRVRRRSGPLARRDHHLPDGAPGARPRCRDRP